ncbi:hypothetical protein HPB49_003407 [Dermacentor silvarum]|uniref:Uncharacterized protein n=1 Tax=Dermacentor silvarum TaxID=543639 RepID=A0ACB8C724_DERSI|nr:hypothetical protein HPB49_003407 [Dermacentor silvarum]
MNIINTYRLPNTKFQRTPWHHLLRQLEKPDLLWTGDFNSRHAYWGYPDSSAAGRILLDLAYTHHLSLLNGVSTPTRTGNSVQRDTNHDLAWGRGRKTPDCRNLGETFGSDHRILEITVPLPNRQRGPNSIATELKDLDAFRKVATKFQTSTLDAWNHSLHTAHGQTTKTVQRNEDNPQIDGHLVTLWDKRHALTRSWKLTKLNKRLRDRIEDITQETQAYADKLATDNWLDICESADQAEWVGAVPAVNERSSPVRYQMALVGSAKLGEPRERVRHNRLLGSWPRCRVADRVGLPCCREQFTFSCAGRLYEFFVQTTLRLQAPTPPPSSSVLEVYGCSVGPFLGRFSNGLSQRDLPQRWVCGTGEVATRPNSEPPYKRRHKSHRCTLVVSKQHGEI